MFFFFKSARKILFGMLNCFFFFLQQGKPHTSGYPISINKTEIKQTNEQALAFDSTISMRALVLTDRQHTFYA